MKTSSNMVNMLATTYNRHAKLQERFLWRCCHKGNESIAHHGNPQTLATMITRTQRWLSE